MQFDKNSQKFNFFKKKESINLGFRDNKDHLFSIWAITIWMMYGLVSAQFSHKNIEQPTAIQASYYKVGDKVSFIDKVTNLNSLLAAAPLQDISVKEISDDLEMVVKSAQNTNSSILISGYIPETKEEVSLNLTSNKVLVTWENVTSREAEAFKEFWKGDVKIWDKATSLKKMEVMIPLAPVEIPKVEVLPKEDIKAEDKIKALQEKIQNLEKENELLKNAKNVVSKAVEDNPHLKPQQQQIQSYVDIMLKIQQKIKEKD